jgi:hypothetical protein
MEQLTAVDPKTPVAAPKALRTDAEIVDRIFWNALGRAPSVAERKVAEAALEKKPEGVADLLWAVMMKPEFQLIY